MRTSKSLTAGVGAGTSIIAAGSIALAAVSAVVGIKGWPELRDAGVPRAIAVAAEPGAGDASRAAGAASVLRMADAAPDVGETASGTAAARRATARARPGGADARRAARRRSGGGVARSASAGRAATAPPATGASSRPGVVDQVGEAVRGTGERVTSAVEAVVPVPVPDAVPGADAGAAVQQRTSDVGKAVEQVGSRAGSLAAPGARAAPGTSDGVVQDVIGAAGGAVGPRSTTVTETAGGLVR